MNNWVKGPLPLTERTIDVFEGTVCVILRNGEVYDVRGPGRHGGLIRLLDEERRLPLSGSLSVLTFERAPAVSQTVRTSVRLIDGATVEVEMRAAIVPLWQKNPPAVKDVVRRYGVQPSQIQEMAQLELEESMRIMARESLSSLTHAQIHSCADVRTLMKLPAPKGLLTVGRLVSCSISRDSHEEASLAAVRDVRLSQLRELLEAELARLRAINRNEVDTIRRRGQLTGRMDTAIAETEIDATVAKLLGIPAVDVAYPSQRDARLKAKYQTVRSILDNNMDLLPLLADPSIGSATSGLTELISSVFPPPEQAPADTPRRTLPSETVTSPPLLPNATTTGTPRLLLRRAYASGRTGTLEVQLIEKGPDRVIGSIGCSGPNRLMVSNNPDPINVALRALSAAAKWCGVQVGVRVVKSASSSAPGQITITRVQGAPSRTHPDLESALGAWIVAINQLLNGDAVVQIDPGNCPPV